MESLIGSGVETAINQLPCNLVNNFTTSWEQCNFIIRNDCLEEEALDYVYFNYCIMGSRLKYLSILIIIFLLLVFFMTLGTIADEFLCPSLLTIAKNLRMSENLAGITLLAFGNGSSDIFSSLAAASSGKAELIVSELLGAGIFCLSIVAGLIFIKHDFRIAYRPLLRDTIFYLFAVYFIWFICWNQQITLYYALAFILIYVIYLTVALGGQAIYSHLQEKKQQKLIAKALHQMGPIPTVSVKIDQYDDDRRNCHIDGKPPLQEKEDSTADWNHGSDWFVQSHDSIRRRRLSKIKLKNLENEDQSLLQGKQLGDTKYGSNQHVTQIKINYKPESIFNKSTKNDITNEHINMQLYNNNNNNYNYNRNDDKNNNITCNNDNDQLRTKEQSKVIGKLSNIAYVNPAFECISKSENLSNSNGTNGNHIDSGDNNNEVSVITKPSSENYFIETSQKNGKTNPTHLRQATYDDNPNSLSTKELSLSTDDESRNYFPSLDQISINSNDWDNLLAHLNPLNLGQWTGASLIFKIITLVRSPLVLIAICTIPVVDYDKKRNNWCRLLNTFHCISIPMVLLINHELANSPDSKTHGMSISSYAEFAAIIGHYYPIGLLMIGFTSAIYMLITTESEKPPKYHVVFSYIGFFMSILWVYTLVREILGLLKTIGIIFSMSDTTIGLAFLAWGNSLGDIVANLALAEAGYPRMAIGACIGAPLLNLLIGFGLSFAVNLSPGEIVSIDYTPTITLLCLSLAIVILSLMICTLVPPNHSKKPFGYVLISAYFIYFILAIALEFDLISIN